MARRPRFTTSTKPTVILVGGVVSKYKNDPAYGTREFRKKLPMAIRIALEISFKVWFARKAPKHFTRSAFGKYKSEYYKSKKRLINSRTQQWMEDRHEKFHNISSRPLVKSGQLEKQYLQGNFIFNKSNTNFTAKVTNLPRYLNASKGGQINKRKALLATTRGESEEFAKLFDKALQIQINKIDSMASTKTFGKGILTI